MMNFNFKKLVQWLGGILAMVIAGVLTFIAVESIRDTITTNEDEFKDKLLEVPHAPPIEKVSDEQLYDERLLSIELPPGQEKQLKGMELFRAPTGANPSCVTGYVRFTWRVRKPYPYEGTDLEFRQVVKMGGGITELVKSGANGSHALGYCGTIIVMNTSLVPMTVQFRYASGVY